MEYLKNTLQQAYLVVGAVVLSFMVLFLFFGQEGIKFALMLFGGVYIFTVCYNVMKEERLKKQNDLEAKAIEEKYFS